MEVKEGIKYKRIVRGIKFFASEDVAKILGLSILSARLYLKDGKIPGAIKIGRRWFLSSKNLDKWLTGSFIFTKTQAEIIEEKLTQNIETTLVKMRQKQEELKRDSAPKEMVEKLQKRLEGIENYWEDYLKEKIRDR
ncbi:hypothetical protein ES703_35124 [subsurface metagenome]